MTPFAATQSPATECRTAPSTQGFHRHQVPDLHNPARWISDKEVELVGHTQTQFSA